MATTRITSKQQLNISANLDFQNFKGINVGTPIDSGDIANKAYVDAIKQSLDIKDSARVATTGSETYTIVSGSVTLITGTQVDGVTLSVGDRILIKNAPASSGAGAGAGTSNTTQPANGIYVVTNATTNLVVQRSIDADISVEVSAGIFIFVTEGTFNGDNGYVLTTNDSIILGTTGLVFTQFSGAGQINAGAGLTKSGNTLDVVGSSGRIVVNADNIDLALMTPTGTASSAIRRFDLDSYGRVSGVINANLTDVISTIGSSIAANTIFSGPNGSSGSASFRLLVPNDIPNLNTSKLTEGTLGILRGGTGLNTTPTNGRLLIGNGTGYVLSNITQGAGLTVTNGAGTITLANSGVLSVIGTTNQVSVSSATGNVSFSLPQNIHTGAAPTFSTLSLTGGTITVSTPILTKTQTWNAGAVIFTALSLNVVDTASAAGSLLANYQVGGSSRFAVRKDGTITVGIWGGTTLAATVGGTGQTGYAVGDILFASTTTALSKLAGVSIGNVLISGGVSTAPSWGKVGLKTHVSGSLPIASGGTNRTDTSWANGQLLIGAGSGTPSLATLTGSSTITITNGTGSISLNINSTNVLVPTNYVVGEVPSGTKNGVNSTFTLANTPLTGKQVIYVNGIRQQEGGGNDYTISGVTITFLAGAIPQTGDIVLADYLK